jgi:hypothetical protein
MLDVGAMQINAIPMPSKSTEIQPQSSDINITMRRAIAMPIHHVLIPQAHQQLTRHTATYR